MSDGPETYANVFTIIGLVRLGVVGNMLSSILLTWGVLKLFVWTRRPERKSDLLKLMSDGHVGGLIVLAMVGLHY
jgi:hypothetical protein